MSESCIEQRKDFASFRDPAGFVFYKNDEVFRYIAPSYYPQYKKLMTSGLYETLINKEYLIPFREVQKEYTPHGEALIIKPRKIPFISYPYEWTFSQLKEAAQLTLEIQRIALGYGVQLKDASSYNIQFIGTKPIFIDTLSFECWDGHIMWKAYKQFCQHFLGPLTICSFSDPRMKNLLSSHLDGIPLDFAKNLIPKKAYFNSSRFLHLWLHEFFQKKSNLLQQKEKSKRPDILPKKASPSAFGLVESLFKSILNLERKKEHSIWKSYYQGNSYEEEALHQKKKVVATILSTLKPKMLWDLGANEGLFTEIVSKYSQYAVAFDVDLTCIENMYNRLRKQKNESILSLHIDIANPSSGIGWVNKERMGIIERGPCDVALALALIHHLIVSNSISLKNIVKFFQEICSDLIIEYISPSDPKFRQICQTNPKDFSFFTEEFFISNFCEKFLLKNRIPIQKSSRVLYHFQTKGNI